jgi:hypothetical protein
MIQIDYQFSFKYAFEAISNDYYPSLTVRISRAGYPNLVVDIEAHLDTGTSRSLFDGDIIGSALYLDIFTGARWSYVSTAGISVEAWIHRLEVWPSAIGSALVMDIGLSNGPIRRNLLGRDFLDRIQIGFREHHQEFYITPKP